MNLTDSPQLEAAGSGVAPADDGLTIAGTTYASRLLVGTGKYRDFDETRAAIDASGTSIVTVTIRRVNIGQHAGEPNLLDALPPSHFTILPNTGGCHNARDAVYTLQLARDLLDGHKLVKLEVLGDDKTLFPNMPETLKAAEALCGIAVVADERAHRMRPCAPAPGSSRDKSRPFVSIFIIFA